MKEYGLYESASVKIQTLKTAIEVRMCRDCGSQTQCAHAQDITFSLILDSPHHCYSASTMWSRRAVAGNRAEVPDRVCRTWLSPVWKMDRRRCQVWANRLQGCQKRDLYIRGTTYFTVPPEHSRVLGREVSTARRRKDRQIDHADGLVTRKSCVSRT